MLVSYLIKHLQEEYKPDQEIMVQWFAKDHVEENNGETIDEDLWSLAVRMFEKYEITQDDFGVDTCLLEAKERIDIRQGRSDLI
jgi:hypothetical protein